MHPALVPSRHARPRAPRLLANTPHGESLHHAVSPARDAVLPSRFARRAGLLAFTFFLAKGLVWLALAALGLQAL